MGSLNRPPVVRPAGEAYVTREHTHGAQVKQVGFRGRLFFILLSFALIPTLVLAAAWEFTVVHALPELAPTAAMERIAATGNAAVSAVSTLRMTAAQRAAVDDHQRALREGMLRMTQMEYLMTRRAPLAVGGAAVIAALLLILLTSRVAGHLSRNMSRPLSELVGWTAMIERGEPLPDVPPRKGAPEFVVLRNRMREMSGELQLGRTRALEAERATALRESARQVAHELKNPLTPIRFAVARLYRDAPDHLRETIEVLDAESKRLEEMAKSFAQFGRLPDGPRAPVDVGEMARSVARASVPPERSLELDVEDDVPMVPGHVDALGRALTNVLLNAVEASSADVPITLSVRNTTRAGRPMVEVAVRDEGTGISAQRLERIWEPYVTHKPGGTGLGLAIVRQTLLAHEGAVEVESTPGKGTTMRLLIPATD